jgi:ABC-2 type transport system permease protein
MKGAFAWSLRRELWEHRAIFVGPLVVAGLALLAFLASLGNLNDMAAQLAAMPLEQRAFFVATPFSMSSTAVVFTGYLVAMVYCLDALHSERRDRSILFWKSMPVSDLQTVASKFTIPMAVQPLAAWAVALGTQVVMILAATLVGAARGADVGALWSAVPWGSLEVSLLYGIVVHTLWFAPLYGYLLAVSAWAKRGTFLWAVLPLFMIAFAERLAFGTSHFTTLLKYRFSGAMEEAFVSGAQDGPVGQLSQLAPLHFLSTPGLWLGFVAAAAFLAAAVRLRRYREPL